MATRENLGFIFLFSNFTILLLFKFCSWPNTVTPVLTIDKVLLPMEKLHLDKIIFTPSVYLRVMGGLGNQLFQYSCSYTIARKHNIPFYLVSPGQSESGANRSFAAHERLFGLDYFQLGYHTEVDDTWKFSSQVQYLKDKDILSGLFSVSNSTLQPMDFCQSESFFAPYRKEILAAFEFSRVDRIETPEVLEWKRKIDGVPNSVALHIRRGDFNPMIRVRPEFYRKAVTQITEMLSPVEPVFFVFTDEMSAAKLKLEFKFLFESNFTVHLVSNSNQTNSLQELYLMKSCQHQIIPNSSFGWWAAYLNKNPGKIIIAAHHNPKLFDSIHREMPKEANYYKFQYRYFYYPQNWFVMDPFNESVL